MTAPLRKNDELFTYRDYMNWSGDERWELIEGIPFEISPAPSPYHQEILLNLSFEIKKNLKDKICKIYIAPFDVRLSEKNQNDEETLTVVQPDGKVVMVHRLNEQKLYGRAEIYGKDDSIPLKLKEETIEINLGAVF